MIIQAFVDRFHQRFAHADSGPSSMKNVEKEATERDEMIADNGETEGLLVNEKANPKLKHHVTGGSITATTNLPSLISLRTRRRSPKREGSIEKQIEFDETEATKIPTPAAQRRTMSRQKFEAVKASIALNARNKVEEKRRKSYEKAVEQVNMGFVEYDDTFDKEFETFLDDDQKEHARKEREREQYWHHSFRLKKKKKKKTKKQPEQNEESRPPPQPSPAAEINRLNHEREILRQFLSFYKNLPMSPAGSIFVRVLEERFDLQRVLITGPHGTPYANGLFYFDFWSKNYPNSPPRVKFLTTGNGRVRFNPNLYNSGKVCLSLLGTWNGPGWNPSKSSLLQVFLSLQGLVLGTDEPFYNEPGYGSYKGRPQYQRESNRYNKNIRKQTLKWAILDPLRKIVLQEERIDARKRFLKKLKEQRDQEKDERIVTAGDGDGRDNSHSNLAPSGVPNSDFDKTLNEKSSKKEKKPRWRSISNLWAGTPQPPPSLLSNNDGLNEEDWEDTTLLPSDVPPKQTYEYTEFSDVVIQHFLEAGPYIVEQCDSWYELDPRGTKFLVDDIRRWYKRLLELVVSRMDADKNDKADRERKDRDEVKSTNFVSNEGNAANVDTRVGNTVPTNK